MLFLLTNDDGYRADGLKLLTRTVSQIGEVFVIAPDREQSAKSHALSLDDPIRVTKLADNHYTVTGTPTDCVLLGVYGDLSDRKPDFVISGINHGNNLGDDITYSGTVAAAMEGTLLGIPSLAISHSSHSGNSFAKEDSILKNLIEKLVSHELPDNTFLNVNLPAIELAKTKGVRITNLGKRRFRENVIRDTDPRGKTLYWIGGERPDWRGNGRADFKAIRDGYISITPVQMDLTNHDAIEKIEQWKFSL